MKALSLWQPHATLMHLGEKRIETRGKRINHVGELAIHAAQRWLPDQLAQIKSHPFASRLGFHGITSDNVVHDLMPRGAVTCVVDVMRCVESELIYLADGTPGPALEAYPFEVGPAEFFFGNYAPGRFGCFTANLRRLPKPVLCRGMQAVPFTLPADVEALVRVQLATLCEGCGEPAGELFTTDDDVELCEPCFIKVPVERRRLKLVEKGQA